MNYMEVKKLEKFFQDGILEEDEDIMGIRLNSQDNKTGFILCSSWYPVIKYAFLYQDAEGNNIKKIVDSSKKTCEVSDECIEIYVKDNIEFGKLLVRNNKNLLNYNSADNDNPFSLFLSMTFSTGSKEKPQANTLILSYDSCNVGCVVAPTITKRKALIAIDNLTNIIIGKE